MCIRLCNENSHREINKKIRRKANILLKCRYSWSCFWNFISLYYLQTMFVDLFEVCANVENENAVRKFVSFVFLESTINKLLPITSDLSASEFFIKIQYSFEMYSYELLIIFKENQSTISYSFTSSLLFCNSSTRIKWFDSLRRTALLIIISPLLLDDTFHSIQWGNLP